MERKYSACKRVQCLKYYILTKHCFRVAFWPWPWSLQSNISSQSHQRRPSTNGRQLLPCSFSSLWGDISYTYMNFYQRVTSEGLHGHGAILSTASDTKAVKHSAALCCCHRATATANTLTTQYMVRFSHLTVQLPKRQTHRRHYTVVHVKFLICPWWKALVILYRKCNSAQFIQTQQLKLEPLDYRSEENNVSVVLRWDFFCADTVCRLVIKKRRKEIKSTYFVCFELCSPFAVMLKEG